MIADSCSFLLLTFHYTCPPARPASSCIFRFSAGLTLILSLANYRRATKWPAPASSIIRSVEPSPSRLLLRAAQRASPLLSKSELGQFFILVGAVAAIISEQKKNGEEIHPELLHLGCSIKPWLRSAGQATLKRSGQAQTTNYHLGQLGIGWLLDPMVFINIKLHL